MDIRFRVLFTIIRNEYTIHIGIYFTPLTDSVIISIGDEPPKKIPANAAACNSGKFSVIDEFVPKQQ